MRRHGIYGNRIEKACEVCHYGRRSADGKSVLCRRKGVMPCGGKCRKFEYDPLRRIPPKPLEPTEHTAEEFSLDTENAE